MGKIIDNTITKMITKIINEIKGNRWVLRSIIPSIYFNFHY